MSTVVLRNSRFPIGQSVGAYTRGAWRPVAPPEGPPAGAAVETQTVAADGTLTFTTLTDGVTYYAYAQVSGQDRIVSFMPGTANPARPRFATNFAAGNVPIWNPATGQFEPGSAGAYAEPNTVPADLGLLAEPFDVALCQLQSNPSATNQYLVKVPVRATTLFGTAFIAVGVGGSGATPLAACFLGLYDAAGVLRGKTADQAAAWATAGGKSAALVAEAGQSLTIAGADGYCWVSLIIGTQATTPMQARTGSQAAASTTLTQTQATTPPARFLQKAAVGSALPATITLSTFTVAPAAWWLGLGA